MKKQLTATLLGIALSLAFCACSQKETKKSIVYSLKDIPTLEEPMLLSEILGDGKVIRLDSNPKAFVDGGSRDISENYIATKGAAELPVCLFDKKTGDFLNHIGNTGRGPGEYSISVYDVMINEEADRIFINPFASTMLIGYNLKGKMLGVLDNNYFKLPERRKARFIMDENTITTFILPFQNDTIMGTTVERKTGKLIKSYKNVVKTAPNFNQELITNRVGDTLIFSTTTQPSVFLFDNKTKEVKEIIKITPTSEGNMLLISPKLLKNGLTLFVCESNDRFELLSITSLLLDENYSNPKKIKLIDDYMFGVDAGLDHGTGDGETLAVRYSMFKLMAMLEERINSGDLDPQMKKEAEAFLATLSENDNDIIVYGNRK